MYPQNSAAILEHKTAEKEAKLVRMKQSFLSYQDKAPQCRVFMDIFITSKRAYNCKSFN